MSEEERIAALEREVLILRGALMDVLEVSVGLPHANSIELDKRTRDDEFAKIKRALNNLWSVLTMERKTGQAPAYESGTDDG